MFVTFVNVSVSFSSLAWVKVVKIGSGKKIKFPLLSFVLGRRLTLTPFSFILNIKKIYKGESKAENDQAKQ